MIYSTKYCVDSVPSPSGSRFFPQNTNQIQILYAAHNNDITSYCKIIIWASSRATQVPLVTREAPFNDVHVCTSGTCVTRVHAKYGMFIFTPRWHHRGEYTLIPTWCKNWERERGGGERERREGEKERGGERGGRRCRKSSVVSSITTSYIILIYI